MTSLRERVRSLLGDQAEITGWAYRPLRPGELNHIEAAVQATRGGIGDRGNLRLLLVVDVDQLDPVADAAAIGLLAQAPEGTRLAYEIAYQVYDLPLTDADRRKA